MPTEVFIDAGQSGIKARLRDGTRTIDAAFPGIRTDLALVPQLTQIVQRMADLARTPVHSVAAGVSGLTESDQNPTLLLQSLDDTRVQEVILAHDSIPAFLSALGYGHGVVVAAGTGVVTLAVGPDATARVDGWGHLIGDTGSGYWLGRAGLAAVMRAHDGRGPATALTAAVTSTHPDLETMYLSLQTDPDRVSRIAAHARTVTRLAHEDPVCAQICREAAAELAHSAATALDRVGLAGAHQPMVCGIGGVFSSAEIHDPFVADLRGRWPAVDVRSPLPDALAGVERLSRLPAGHPLTRATFRAAATAAA